MTAGTDWVWSSFASQGRNIECHEKSKVLFFIILIFQRRMSEFHVLSRYHVFSSEFTRPYGFQNMCTDFMECLAGWLS